MFIVVFIITFFKCSIIVYITFIFIKITWITILSDGFRTFGRPVYWFGPPNSGPKTLFNFFFSSCISKKNLSSDQSFHNSSNYFEMMAQNTIIQTKEENNQEKEFRAKEETVSESVFIHLTT